MGVGINILPMLRELCELGKEAMTALPSRTSNMNYYARQGKLVIHELCGTYAGYRYYSGQYTVARYSAAAQQISERAGAGKWLVCLN